MRLSSRAWALGSAMAVLAVSAVVAQPAAAAPAPVTDLVAFGTLVGIDTSSPGAALNASWTLPGDATGAFVCVGTIASPPTECSASTPGRLDVAAPARSTALGNSGDDGKTLAVMVVSYDASGATGPAVTATLRGTSQPLQPGMSVLVYGQKLTVSTRLTYLDDGSPVVGQPVDLVACSVVGTSCPSAGHATTDANGVASAVITATNTVNFHIAFRGAAGLGASYGLKSIATKFGIVTHITKTTVRVGHITYLWGRLTPKLTGARVYLYQRGYVPRKYVKVAYQKMPNGVWMTGYKIAFKPTRAAKYKITATKPARRTATVYIGAAVGKWFVVKAV